MNITESDPLNTVIYSHDNRRKNLEQIIAWSLMLNKEEILRFRMLKDILHLPPQDFERMCIECLFNGRSPTDLRQRELIKDAFVIPLTNLQEPATPSWAVGRVFEGIKYPKVLDLNTLTLTCITHGKYNMTLEDIFTSLAGFPPRIFSPSLDLVCHVDPYANIRRCHGLRALCWLNRNVRSLPVDSLVHFNKSLMIFGWMDAMYDKENVIRAPYVLLDPANPDTELVRWLDVDKLSTTRSSILSIATARHKILYEEEPTVTAVTAVDEGVAVDHAVVLEEMVASMEEIY